MAHKSIEQLLTELLEKLATHDVGPDTIIRGEQKMFDLTGLRRSQRDALIEKGDFPSPARLGGLGGRAKGWFAREIAAWQRKRRAERDAKRGRDDD